MKTIYLVDYIGTHSGMDYYLESFKSVISGINEWSVCVLSNWSSDGLNKPFFLNQYKGSKILKSISLLRNLYRFKRFVVNHPDDVFIYLTYGNWIDLYFMEIVQRAPYSIIDIHEGIAQNIDKNLRIFNKFKNLYKNKIRTVISHSQRTNNFLKSFGYDGRIFQVPHFKYIFPKSYERQKVSADIFESIDCNRINLLFFGNLNKSKGVDILLDSVNHLHSELANKINVIIAGKDFDGSVWKIKAKPGRHVHIFSRHISDDELRYLYQSVDYLCLPYRKTSQSGILEMAFYFKKPIISSTLDYFEKTLKEFPSFGVLAGNSVEDYSDTLKNIIINGKDVSMFFNDEDYARYENRKEVNEFKKVFRIWLKEI